MSNERKVKQGPVYPYKVEGQSYRLGEQKVAPIIERVYTDLNSLPQGSMVLDVGCGAGRLGRNAPKDRPYRILGVDISEGAIEEYRQAIVDEDLPDLAVAGDITEIDFRKHNIAAAVSWRVLHALPPELQRRTSTKVREALPLGANFHIAVLSDEDRKKEELERLGLYAPGVMNDCAEIMELDRAWPLYFFSESDLKELADQTGFTMNGVDRFQEPSGFPHVQEKFGDITYLFARMKKTNNK
jgi:cyclopropane fatty-acyl-phospholipid synthase-like methyltransferase